MALNDHRAVFPTAPAQSSRHLHTRQVRRAMEML
jgi:hypothetical protein